MNRQFKYLFVFMFLFITMNFVSATAGIINLTDPAYLNKQADFNASFTDTDYTTLNNPAWNISKSTFLRTLSISAKETIPTGLFFKPDGKEMYITGSTSDNIHQYTLSTDWNISSATFTRSFSVATKETTPNGLFFSPTGDKMYIIGTTQDRVIQYNLSTNWDISSAVYDQNVLISTKETTASGVALDSTGTYMYITGSTSDAVHQYTLGTPYAVATAVFTRTLNIIEKTTNVTDVTFDYNGTRMYITESDTDNIYQYNLSTAWNIATALYDQNFSVTAKETVPTATYFNPNGSGFYVLGSTSDSVHQYNTENIVNYKYSFGYNTTNDFNGSETYIDTNQTLDYAQTTTKYFNLNNTFTTTELDIYSFFTVHRYINSDYNTSYTGWSSTTFDARNPTNNIIFYNENTLSAIPTVTITDANGSTYTSDINGLWSVDLVGAKSFEISKAGYDSRPFEFYFTADANYNFLLNPTGLDSNIGFIVKDTNNNLWTNKYLMFQQDKSVNTKLLGSYLNAYNGVGTNAGFKPKLPIQINSITFKANQNTNIAIKIDYWTGGTLCTSSTVSATTGNTYTVNFTNCYITSIVNYQFVCSTGGSCFQNQGISGYATNPYIEPNTGTSYVFSKSGTGNVGDINISILNPLNNNIINSLLTSSQGYATANILPAGDYNALLYNATGDLNYTYAKTTVTVNKPKNEKTSALISPYDIYVSGLLQYSLTNQSASSVAFNVFAGTTDFYTFTAVDYNTVVADQKYIPKTYFVQVPMGNSYVNAITYQPYLLLKTDGIVPKVVILDQLNRTIENAQIYVSKYVGGILTVVESGNTFSNGAFNFSAYPLDVYYLTVYYNGTDYGTFSVQPRESSDIFYIKIDRTTAEDIAQALIIKTNLDDTSRYHNRDTNINVLGTITSNFNYITDYNVNVYERGNLVYSSNTVATGLSIDINKFVDVNLIPDYVHSAVIKIIVNYSIAGVTGSQTFSKNIMITDSPDVIGTIEDAQTEIGQPLSIFIALAVAIMLMAILIFSGIITDPSILAVFGALVIGVFMMLGFLDIGVVVLGMDIGRFAYFLGLMATLYFALFGGR